MADIEARVLKLEWDVDNPQHLVNLESIARQKRFQALGRACKDSNIKSLLLAHHGNDQAETVLSRLVNKYEGSGLRGIKAEGKIPECHGIHGVSGSGWPCNLCLGQGWSFDSSPTRMQSSSAPMQVESGGIRIYRPLLGFSKSSLITTCIQNGVHWFEDATNADETLTIRNTIRHLLQEKRLPEALSTGALIQMAYRVAERAQSRDETADMIFNSCKIEMDMCSSSLVVQYPSSIRDMLLKDDQIGQTGQTDRMHQISATAIHQAEHLAALVVRRLLSLISPKPGIELQTLDLAVKYSFPFLADKLIEIETANVTSLNVASVVITKTVAAETNTEDAMSQIANCKEMPTPRVGPTGNGFHPTVFKFEVQRPKMPTGLTLLPASLSRDRSVLPTWTEWSLFHGRFWIRIRYRPFNLTPSHSISLRLLKEEDITNVRDRDAVEEGRAGRASNLNSLRGLLNQTAAGKSRYTLPVIIESFNVRSKPDSVEVKENVCALPTIGWGMSGWEAGSQDKDMSSSWEWECRYRAVEFGEGESHSFERINPPRRRKFEEQ